MEQEYHSELFDIRRVSENDKELKFPELAIIIVKQYQGQGYGELLLKEWLNWICTTMGYHRINIRIDSSNTRSIKLFRKLKAIVDREEDIIYCHLDLPIEWRNV